MRQARIMVNNIFAGVLEEIDRTQYIFRYNENYEGMPVSLTMPVRLKEYSFSEFPAFFEGLLPEGILLDALLRKYKLDRNDYFGQLIKVGKDVVGAITVEEMQ